MPRIARALILVSVLAFGLAAAPDSASAQNASAAGTLETYPTFNSIGVRLPYTGDADADAVAHLEWRLDGETTWRRGVDMTRITNSRWAGSVLWVPDDRLIEVRAVVEDPDGGAVASGSVRTRREPQADAPNAVLWVATNGSDANAGTSAAPLATLQVAADRANAGDEIRVRPGIYYQTLHGTRAGTAAARIRVVADGPGVVLDGSDPALLHAAGWRDDDGGVYSISYAGTTRLVAADSTQRLYRHASLAELQASAHGIAQGWTVADGRLHVRLEDGSSPANHTMHVARYDNGVFVEAPHWHVSGLEVRHYGTTAAACGIHVRAASDCWIEGNDVHTCAGRGIWLRVGAADCLIERNRVHDPRVGGWPWDACKSHEEEITAISNRGGRGNVIRANTVEGWFDGLDANNGQTDENIAADADFAGNVVTGCGDDAIETDTISGINLRLWDNVFDGNYSGISVAPITQGPEYILYNTITDYRRSAFKFSLSSTGHTWICHNTTWSGATYTAAVWPSGAYSNVHFRDNILTGNGLPCVNDETGESQTGNDFDGDLLYATGSSTLFQWKSVRYANLAAVRSGIGFEACGAAGDPLFVSPATGDFTLQAASPAADAGTAVPGVDDCYGGTAPDIGGGEFCGPDGLVAVAVALEDAQAEPGLVTVTWYATDVTSATVYRNAGAAWSALGTVYPDGTGRLTLEDRDVQAGARYGYRLGVDVDGAEELFGETWVDVPSGLALALAGARPNPAREGLVVAFTLPTAAGGRLEVVDVSGRRMLSRSLAGLPAGSHQLRLDDGTRLAPGIYLLRLSQGERSLTARACVVR